MKWLSIAVAKYVRRYRRLCKWCDEYAHPYVRYVCYAVCVRFIHRCDPRRVANYVACIDFAIDRTKALVERIKQRLTV